MQLVSLDGRVAAICLASIICSAVMFCDGVSAQPLRRTTRRPELSLPLPEEPPRLGNGRRVTIDGRMAGDVKGVPGQRLVVQVLVEVGDSFVVVLPDGRLLSLPQKATRPTDGPFVPTTQPELLARLKKQFPGFKSRVTKRYVYVYNTSRDFAVGTSRILETLYPGLYNYCRRQKIDVHPPDSPLVVIMFKTRKEFERYRQQPSGVLAYYDSISNHVVMYEQSELAQLAPELALKRSISTIAHEGVHQILHNIGVQQRLSRWPMWISEGLSEYFAPTEMKARARWKGVGLVNDLRLYELQQAFRQRPSLRSGGQSIRETVESESLDSLGYASSWSLVHFLAAKRRSAFYDYLREVSQLAPLAQLPADGTLFRKHFGDDYASVEDQWIKHLLSLPHVDPVADQTHFVAVVRQGTRFSLIITTSAAKVREFQRQSGGETAVRAFPDRPTAERFVDSLR